VWVPASTSLSLTLCLHELATNAVKYGALSNGTGRVRLSWNLAGEAKRRLRLMWIEVGGPPVKVPERKGFGSLLIKSTGEAETSVDFHPDGLRCRLDLSL
jgi:two-component sensor histidine kinase